MNVFLSFLSDDNWQGDPLTMREFEGNGELFDANFFAFVRKIGSPDTIFLLTGLHICTGEYKAQGPTLCPTEGRALRGPRALYSPV